MDYQETTKAQEIFFNGGFHFIESLNQVGWKPFFKW